MHPIKFVLLATTAAMLALTTTSSAQAQNLSINGTPCTFTTYTKTVNAAGVPTFSFTAPGCNTGSGGSTSPGTIQFSASSYPSVDAGGTRTINVTRTGHIPGGNNALNGTVSVDAGSSGFCNITGGPAAVSFPDGDSGPKAITVNATAVGTCNLTLSGTGVVAPFQTAFDVTNANAPGVFAFTAPNQTATAGSTTPVTITVARTAAGSSSGPANVSFNCVGTGLSTTAPITVSPLAFTSNGNGTQVITITSIPALSASPTPGTIVCTLTATTAGTLGAQTTHTVNVTATPIPVCSPTVTTVPGSLVAGTGGTANFTANCTNSPTGYTWTPVTAGAPALTNANTATPSVTVGAGVAAGSYQYSLVASNAGGNSATANASFTVSAAPVANCVIKDKAADYPNWMAGNNPAPLGSPGSVGAPEIFQAALETIAYRFELSELYNPVDPGATGNFSLYEPTLGVATTMSITVNPCEFTNSPVVPACQRTNGNGNFGLNYTRFSHPAGNDALINANYCRLPNPGSQTFLYVNIRYAPAASAANPTGSTCVQGTCRYVPLYVRGS